jgi:hypothetical protein
MKLWRNGEEGTIQNDLHSATADELKAVLLAIKVVIKTLENSVPVPAKCPKSITLVRVTIN